MEEEHGSPSSRARPHTKVPGPRGSARLRTLGRILTSGDRPTEALDPAFFAGIRDEYGPIARIATPVGPDLYVLSKPEYVRHVLEENQSNYRKYSAQVEELTKIFGRGLVTSDGAEWRRDKRVLSKLFTRGRLDPFSEVIADLTESKLEAWSERDGEIRLVEESFDLVLGILGISIFGDGFEHKRGDVEAVLDAIGEEFPREASPIPTLPDWIPTPHNRRMHDATSKFDRTVAELIQIHTDSGGNRDTFLSQIEDDSVDLTRKELRDQLKTLLIAGSVTVAALAWTLYSLADDIRVQNELRSRLVDGEADAEAPVLMDDDPSLLTAVIRETLRIHPPLPPAVRSPLTEDTIGGYRIPSGSKVVVNQVQIQRDPAIWADPLSFRPERFDAGWAEDKPNYSYYPFGGGGRMCIGRVFAYTILRRIVGRVVQAYRVSYTGPDHSAKVSIPGDLSVRLEAV